MNMHGVTSTNQINMDLRILEKQAYLKLTLNYWLRKGIPDIIYILNQIL